jgi:cytidylate kinase
VRARLLELQHAAIAAALEGSLEGGGIVVEGRDIGSVVAPDADVKVYLTADASARAARRAAEEGGSDLAATESSLLARDRIDSTRTASPLVIAEGAVHIDSTPYTLEEVVDLIAGMVEAVG